jgi:hypothetical protein
MGPEGGFNPEHSMNAAQFNLSEIPGLQDYVEQKGNPDITGEAASDLSGMQEQRAAMVSLTELAEE